MERAQQQPIKRITAEEFFALPDDGIRRELIDGIIHIKVEAIDDRPLGMAGASPKHQAVVRELTFQLTSFLKGKPCDVFNSPVDVQLNPDFDDTFVQPDIFVICDSSRFDGRAYKGAPTLIIEVLSTTTAKNDRLIKMEKYRQAGVREYWIVDPSTQLVEVYLLFDKTYTVRAYSNENTDVSVVVLEGCAINLAEVFAAADRVVA